MSETPTWQAILGDNLEANLRRWGFTADDPHWRWAFDDLEGGWPYGVILGALEATRQHPPVSYYVAKVNQAQVALAQLRDLQQKRVI